MTATRPADDTLRRTGTTVASLAASELLGKIGTLVMFVLLARLLGLAQFGVVSLGLGLGLLLAMIPSLGVDARVVQLGSARPEILDRCYGALVAIRMALCAAICVVTVPILLATLGRAEAETVSLLIVACLLETFSDAARACCAARQAQYLSALVLVVQRFVTLALVAGALLVHPQAWLAALVFLIGTAVGVAAMHLAARRAGVRMQLRGSLPQTRQILRAAPVMGLNAFVSMGLFRIDTALVGVMLGTTAVGIYGANYRLFETVTFVSWTLSRAVVPVIAGRPDDVQHARRWTQLSMLTLLALYVPYGVVLALRGDDIVGSLLGPAYADPGLLAALALAPLFFGIAHQCSSVLFALRPDPVVLIASGLALVANIGLNLVLIPVLGIRGAAIATTLSFVVQAVILLLALHRRIGPILAPRDLAGIVAGSAAAAVAYIVITPLLPALLLAGGAYLGVVTAVTIVVNPGLMVELGSLRQSGVAVPLPDAPGHADQPDGDDQQVVEVYPVGGAQGQDDGPRQGRASRQRLRGEPADQERDCAQLDSIGHDAGAYLGRHRSPVGGA